MRYLRLILAFIDISLQEETAYRANFSINLLHSLLVLATGLLSLGVIYNQVDNLQGWDYGSAQMVLGVFLTVSALRGLVIGPSLDSLAGMDGEVWQGAFDFSLLRPLATQFLVSLRRWRLFALFDLLLGLAVLATAVIQTGVGLTPWPVITFILTLTTALFILYAILLAAASLVFWYPGFMIVWLFDAVFQMARYPVGVYPGWLRLLLTWIVPVGIITTVPAAALTGGIQPGLLVATLLLALILVMGASLLFRLGLRRYASASS